MGRSWYCRFQRCKNNSGMKIKGLRFYRFPKDEKKCKVWVKACQNKKLEEIPASKLYISQRICSDHFQDWCFLNTSLKHRLVYNAIPNSPKPNARCCKSHQCSTSSYTAIINSAASYETRTSSNNSTSSMTNTVSSENAPDQPSVTENSTLRQILLSSASQINRHTKIHNIKWPCIESICQIVNKMKKPDQAGIASDKQDRTGESGSEKSRNEIQKFLLIAPEQNVCIEADMETILEAMNSEDIASENNESTSALEIVDTVNSPSNSDLVEVYNNESLPYDMMSEISSQSVNETTTPKNALEDEKVNSQCTTSSFPVKKNTDNQELNLKIENVYSMAKKPVAKTLKSKTCDCIKDEFDLYATLLANKLRNIDEKSRHTVMNKIDDIFFKIQYSAKPSSSNLKERV